MEINEAQQKYIQKLCDFLIVKDDKNLNLENLKGIKAVPRNKLPTNSSMHTENDVISIPEDSLNNIMSKINLDGLNDELSKPLTQIDEDLYLVLSNLYHELIHIDAEQKFPLLHKQLFNLRENLLTRSIIRCWIEFYVEKETVLSKFSVKDEFSQSFVDFKWDIKYFSTNSNSNKDLFSLIRYIPYLISKFQDKKDLNFYLAQIKDDKVKIFADKLYDIFNDLYLKNFDSYEELKAAKALVRDIFNEIL